MKWFLTIIMAIIMVGCSQKDPDNTSNFLKSPYDFGLDLYPDSTQPTKYVLSWENPIQIEGLQGIKIFLDTANWKTVVNNHDAGRGAILLRPSNSAKRDSILFSFKAGGAPIDTMGLYNGIPYFQFDSTGHLDSSTFEFDFALISIYSDGPGGDPVFTRLIVDDRFKPSPVKPVVDFTDREIFLTWSRPRDPTSFFDLEADTGIIAGYHLIIREVPNPSDSSGLHLNLDSITLSINDINTTLIPGTPLPNGFSYAMDDSSNNVTIISFFPDGNRFHFNSDSNSISLILYGFIPERKYDFQIYAEDANSNLGKNDAEIIQVITTDTTQPQPITAELIADSLTKNRFKFYWTPSQDTRPGDNQVNQNIKEYRVRRTTQVDTAGPTYGENVLSILPVRDLLTSPIKENQSAFSYNSSAGRFEGSYFFLPPSSTYKVQIWAVDSTGHRSDTSEIILSTLDVDTSIICPDGFIPIPSKSTDSLLSFCIEPQEHQQDSVHFDTHVDQKLAQSICQSLGSGVDLCTESQWVRACEGSSLQYPLKYGIQAITDNPGLSDIALPNTILQSKCNQAAGDEEMARTESLRNKQCVTDEGVFDLAGNYSEWVLSDSSTTSLLFKGGNYLVPTLDITQIRNLALCSYRGIPRQKRPNYLPRCLSEERHLALVYRHTNGKDSVLCPDMTGNIDRIAIEGSAPNRYDSATLVIHFKESGINSMRIALIDSTDSLKMKPPRVVLNDSLPIVYFLPDSLLPDSANLADYGFADTLIYSDFINSGIPLLLDGQPSDHPVLTREMNDDYWQALPTSRIFGYVFPTTSIPHSKPAKPFYSNSVVGFRCCSTVN